MPFVTMSNALLHKCFCWFQWNHLQGAILLHVSKGIGIWPLVILINKLLWFFTNLLSLFYPFPGSAGLMNGARWKQAQFSALLFFYNYMILERAFKLCLAGSCCESGSLLRNAIATLSAVGSIPSHLLPSWCSLSMLIGGIVIWIHSLDGRHLQ